MTGLTAIGSTTTIRTRKDRTQRVIDSIKNETSRMKTELAQIGKDIYDNVLEYTERPGALNSATIDAALKTGLWSGPKVGY